MKCPHCNKEVSFYSPSVSFRSAMNKRCPHCDRPVLVYVKREKPIYIALFVAVALMLLALALPPPFREASLLAGLAITLVFGAFALRSMELHPGTAQERR